MTELCERPDRRDAIYVGSGLIVIGLLALAMVSADIDPSEWLGGSGWTLFVFVPGAILLAAGLLSRGDAAEGLTIAGSIVITVAALLFGMDRTGHWESWAYAWALIPAAAGLGVVLYGLRTGDRSDMNGGIRLILVALAMLVVGAWFFETMFQTGEVPFSFGEWWPLTFIALGAIVILLSLVGRPREQHGPTPSR
jgi:hypothetical protein